MAFITPGIHEGCKFLAASTINDKGTLELHVEIGQTDLLAAFAGNDTMDTMQGKFLIFPPSTTSFEGEPNTVYQISEALMKMRKLLLGYAALYGPKADAEAAFGGNRMFEDIGITTEQIPELVNRLTDEKILGKVSTNLQTKFLAYLKGLESFETTQFRHKFWRKNLKENFAVIPNSFDIFVESMDIPKEASQIVWNEWEIKNKKNDPTTVAADATTDAPEDNQNLFETDENATEGESTETIDSLI